MDLINLRKIHAINKSKKYQLRDNFFLYSITVLACSLFCSSPFWFPSPFSSLKLFLFVSLPKISSFFLSSKFLFIVGNLIIIVLVGESKFFASNCPPVSDVYYDEYINRKRSLQTSSTVEEKKERKVQKTFKEKAIKISEDGGKIEKKGWGKGHFQEEKEREDTCGEDELSLPTDELNKRADDFIARVNEQMRLEARLRICYSK